MKIGSKRKGLRWIVRVGCTLQRTREQEKGGKDKASVQHRLIYG